MFIELIATFVAGVAGAGLVFLLNHLLKGRLPRWLAPVAAGVAMLLATISSEYGWYSRTKASLPEGLVVAQTIESQAIYRPWTYVKPFVERFVAIDQATIQHHSAQPDLRIAQAYFFGRWAPLNKLPIATDCASGQRAALSDAITFENDGTIKGVDWVKAPANDPIIEAVCGAG
ncbi:hypothetical protein [Polycladidibacter stylochi]|uniref:hypothetical protein n=1 Tax=Polycladidibacter stylochi TaxID=1807766 RepID=UPI00082BD834|nr:hypothetical protein [Pseudovibrio stylochi]